MSEPLLRFGLALGVLVVGLAVGLWLRRSERGRPAFSRQTRLGPGVYLFSSRDCLDCVQARAQLHDLLEGSFVEITWEESPAMFGELGVDLVPSTVVVGHDGSASINPGVPLALIERLSP